MQDSRIRQGRFEEKRRVMKSLVGKTVVAEFISLKEDALEKGFLELRPPKGQVNGGYYVQGSNRQLRIDNLTSTRLPDFDDEGTFYLTFFTSSGKYRGTA